MKSNQKCCVGCNDKGNCAFFDCLCHSIKPKIDGHKIFNEMLDNRAKMNNGSIAWTKQCTCHVFFQHGYCEHTATDRQRRNEICTCKKLSPPYVHYKNCPSVVESNQNEIAMKQTIENIIKKNLPEKKEEFAEGFNDGETKIYNQALSQINPSLIADEVLKVVADIKKDVIGNIGGKLLAKHAPQIVLDYYFDVANEELENEINN